MQESLGKMFGTAPTNVATDNLADRLDSTSRKVIARLNAKRSADQPRAQRTFIVRGFKLSDEYDTFINLLKDPSLGNRASPRRDWSVDSKWMLHLSLAYWLLMIMGSQAVRGLHDDDHPAIHRRRSVLKGSPIWGRLYSRTEGKMSWQEYESGPMVEKSAILSEFHILLNHANILCTTPALGCQRDFKDWREQKARGIIVDEAGNMCRPDLYSIWGNTLLPCLLVGDDKQLPPAVMSFEEKDRDGNHHNRLGGDGRISALEFFKASGWPVFRLRTQLRMANGLFNTCHREVYKDLPFTYGQNSTLANHLVGQDLERYLHNRFALYAPPAGSLLETFVHVPGSTCIVDEATKSKRNPDQVESALEFLCDLVRWSPRINAANISIICPYKANVHLVERRRIEPKFATLRDMPPAATVDSFQGREADIIAVIMGTTQEVGPGFTTDEHRLNVMLSRQKSGLIIFGDIDVLGPMVGTPQRGRAGRGGRGGPGARGARGARGGPGGRVGGQGRAAVRVTADGEQHFGRKGMLWNVMQHMALQGRVVELEAR